MGILRADGDWGERAFFVMRRGGAKRARTRRAIQTFFLKHLWNGLQELQFGTGKA